MMTRDQAADIAKRYEGYVQETRVSVLFDEAIQEAIKRGQSGCVIKVGNEDRRLLIPLAKQAGWKTDVAGDPQNPFASIIYVYFDFNN